MVGTVEAGVAVAEVAAGAGAGAGAAAAVGAEAADAGDAADPDLASAADCVRERAVRDVAEVAAALVDCFADVRRAGVVGVAAGATGWAGASSDSGWLCG